MDINLTEILTPVALAVFSKGEQAYLQEKQRQELTDNLRLRADIDYLAIMSEVEL